MGTEKEEKFYSMCITLPFEEIKDERDESSVPELVHVAELRDSGSMQDAVDYATSLMKMYPDNDLIPFMVAYIYQQKQFPKEAMQTAVSAIPKCPRKYRLYSVAGLAEFDLGHIPEAIVWWSRSVIAQCMIADYQDHDPFLHLAHAAEIVGEQAAAQSLFAVSDAIEPAVARLDSQEIQKMSTLRESWALTAFRRVLQQLDSKYLHGA